MENLWQIVISILTWVFSLSGNELTFLSQSTDIWNDSIVDLSHYNGPDLDLKLTRQAGTVAVWHEVTRGNYYVDPLYDSNRVKASEAGLLWGAYHFAEGDYDAIEQAKYFLTHAKPDGNTILALDFEVNKYGKKNISLEQAHQFVTYVHDHTGIWPVIYGGHWLKQNLGDSEDTILKNCPLWVAQWAVAPVYPKNWDHPTMWQYTDGTFPGPSTTPGVGSCDRDKFYGTEEDMRTFWAQNSPSATVTGISPDLFNGIADLSHHNGTSLDFEAAYKGGMRAAFHKATQGTWMVDPMYVKNRASAQAAGISWGAYHFAEGDSDAVDQAQYFLKNSNYSDNTLLALDYEENPTGKSMNIDQAEQFVTEVHRVTGTWPVVYGGSTLRNDLNGKKSDILANCPLWLAEWVDEPKVVAPTWENYTFWQFTDSKAGPEPHNSPGFGLVDRDIFAGSAEDLIAYWKPETV